MLAGQGSAIESAAEELAEQGEKLSVLYDLVDAECDLDAYRKEREEDNALPGAGE